MLENSIRLNTDGLTVVPTKNSESSETVFIDEIKGQTQKDITWVLRADESGEYKISADYSGILSYFDKPIFAKFEAAKPIVVKGGPKIKTTIETCTETFRGSALYNVVVENIGDDDLVGFSWDSYIESYYDEYVTGSGEKSEMKTQRDVLKPREKFVYHYSRVIDKPGNPYYFANSLVEDLKFSMSDVEVVQKDKDYFLDAYYKKYPEEKKPLRIYFMSTDNEILRGTVYINVAEEDFDSYWKNNYMIHCERHTTINEDGYRTNKNIFIFCLY